MQIVTSYYAKLNKIIDLGYTPISIAGKAPDFYVEKRLPEYKKLAPKIGFFKLWKSGEIDNEGYIYCYDREVLRTLNPFQVVAELEELSGGADKIALLCYEKPGDFCHRRLAADWVEKSLGISVPELTFK